MKIELHRIGIFFVFVGIIPLAIFFTTDRVEGPQVGAFFLGLLLVGIGIFLIRRNWQPAPPSRRFRILRKKEKPAPPPKDQTQT